jgi:flavin reductase (DIM6/NTAB) family NADH-FMN oxidoreductase RutF
MAFETINAKDVTGNFFEMIGDEWMLITAGMGEHFNAMTASWGGVGILWGKQVAHCYVRPQRSTRGFMDDGTFYTLSFYGDAHHKALLETYGTLSGKDIDKENATGFVPAVSDSGAVYFEQARLVIVCKKLYADDFDPAKFTDGGTVAESIYPTNDFHRMYIGEIVQVLKQAER